MRARVTTTAVALTTSLETRTLTSFSPARRGRPMRARRPPASSGVSAGQDAPALLAHVSFSRRLRGARASSRLHARPPEARRRVLGPACHLAVRQGPTEPLCALGGLPHLDRRHHGRSRHDGGGSPSFWASAVLDGRPGAIITLSFRSSSVHFFPGPSPLITHYPQAAGRRQPLGRGTHQAAPYQCRRPLIAGVTAGRRRAGCCFSALPGRRTPRGWGPIPRPWCLCTTAAPLLMS